MKTMRFHTALAVVAAVGVTVPAFAQGRPSSVSMTCAQTVQLIRSNGALVIGTGGQTYDRFVRDRSFCEATEIAKRAFAPTLNDPTCFVGYTCYEPGQDDRMSDD